MPNDITTDTWEELIEKLAAIEHARWAKWQAYLHSKCVDHSDGKGEWVCFPSESFRHWERQIATHYSELSEQEKESDRNEVRTYLPLLLEQISLAEKRGASQTRKYVLQELETALRPLMNLKKWIEDNHI